MLKQKYLDFATIMVLIIISFVLVTYIVLAVWYLKNNQPIIVNHWKVIKTGKNELQKYVDDPLYCQKDDDCQILNNCCPCPLKPINKYHQIDLDCGPDIACTTEYCGIGTPYCENNKCKIKINLTE